MSTGTAQAKTGADAVIAAVGKLAEKVDAIEKRAATIEDGHNQITKALGNPAVARDPGAEGRWGFQSFSHFLAEVHKTAVNRQPTEMIAKTYSSDYVKKAAAGMGELVGSDGGFLVPPQFSDKIFERVYKENDLLKRTDQYTVTGNAMVFPRNAESSRANGSRWGGARAYWTQEGSTIQASRPTFGRLQMNLHKLACITPITTELIEDSGPAVAQYTQKVFANEINFVVGDSLVNGTGVGQPLGILNAACTISVTAETGQAAATIVPQNIAKMWARRFKAGSTGQYVWLVNQDVGPQLHLMTLGIGVAGQVVYMPPGGLSDSPYATLMGAPVIETEWNATLGTVGDIILVDMGQWVSISKGGMESATSMHVYFTTDEQAFRTTFRLDAQPWWASSLTPYKGSNTQAPAISLATRS